MKYALLIYNTLEARDSLTPESRERIEDAFAQALASPAVSSPVRLAAVETATTVRVEDGETLLTDGPFVDSKEFLAGLFVLDAVDLDGAISVAAQIQGKRTGGAIEVRPLE